MTRTPHQPRTHARRPGPARRPGFTLAEMLVSLSAGSVLMLGLMSALLLSVQTVPTDDDNAVRAAQADRLFEYILADTLIARGVGIDSGTVAMIIPDQTGDDADDTVEYTLNGDLYQRRVNSGEWRTLATGIASASASVETVDGADARVTFTLKTDRDHVYRASFELAARIGAAKQAEEEESGTVIKDLLGGILGGGAITP